MTWKGLAQNFLTMEPFGLQLTLNPYGYIKGTSPDGLMANTTSLFEDWGDANTADRFLNIYFYELNTKQLLQLIFPLSNIVNKCKILWNCASRNSKYCPQIPLPPLRPLFKTYRVRSRYELQAFMNTPTHNFKIVLNVSKKLASPKQHMTLF